MLERSKIFISFLALISPPKKVKQTLVYEIAKDTLRIAAKAGLVIGPIILLSFIGIH